MERDLGGPDITKGADLITPFHKGEAIRSILILADDLTGAADCAVQFRRAGLSALVLAQLDRAETALRRTQVVSLNLHTRDLPSASRVHRVWHRAAPSIVQLAHEALVYQKIDSTLRGHAALEVRLLLDLLDLPTAIVAPAYPKLGRQTLDGVHRVHGVPLAQTEYARSHRQRRVSSALPELFAATDKPPPVHLTWSIIERGHQAVVDWLGVHLTEPRRLITADAADEGHLDVLTQAVLSFERRLLLVGSAGWAEHLARAGRELLVVAPTPGTLGVVGSLNSVTTRQVQMAEQHGVRVLPVMPSGAAGAMQPPVEYWHAVTTALADGQHVVVWTHPGDPTAGSSRSGRRLLRTVAAGIRQILSTTAVSGLVIVGGDTAYAILHALQASGLSLLGEIAAGIPHGHIAGGPFAGLPTATKAGGFGTDTALQECLDFFRGSPYRRSPEKPAVGRVADPHDATPATGGSHVDRY